MFVSGRVIRNVSIRHGAHQGTICDHAPVGYAKTWRRTSTKAGHPISSKLCSPLNLRRSQVMRDTHPSHLPVVAIFYAVAHARGTAAAASDVSFLNSYFPIPHAASKDSNFKPPPEQPQRRVHYHSVWLSCLNILRVEYHQEHNRLFDVIWIHTVSRRWLPLP